MSPWNFAVSAMGLLLMAAAPMTSSAEPRIQEDRKVLEPSLADRAGANADIIERARDLIREGRETGDPRFYSRAETLILPLMAKAEAADLLVLRATVRQARHDFYGALSDLDKAINTAPNDPQARLSRAFVRMTIGDYNGALIDCQSLPRSAGQLVRAACFGRLVSLTGNAAKADQVLTGALQQMPGAASYLKAWLHTLRAEISIRIGQDPRPHFQRALVLSDNARSVRLSFAEYLVSSGLSHAALDVLDPADTSDAAAVIRLRAAVQTDTVRSDEVKSLAAQFEEDRRADNALHLREEARFLLDVVHAPDRAVDIAQENWAAQKEPEDLLLLVQAAVAAGDLTRASAALVHRDAYGIEDVRVDAVLAVEQVR
ncbi:MAG: hypothetical protein AAF557_22845 [Pseudomonadota bacterium]